MARADQLVAQRQPVRALDDEAVLDALVEAGRQVGVQDPVAAPRRARRARRAADVVGLEGLGRGGRGPRRTSAGRPARAGAARVGTRASARRPGPAPGPRTTRSARRSAARAGRPAAPRPPAADRPDRSATMTSTLADGRSPSIDSMSRASSSRPSGPRVIRCGGRGALGQRAQVVRPCVVAADRVALVRRRRWRAAGRGRCGRGSSPASASRRRRGGGPPARAGPAVARRAG